MTQVGEFNKKYEESIDDVELDAAIAEAKLTVNTSNMPSNVEEYMELCKAAVKLMEDENAGIQAQNKSNDDEFITVGKKRPNNKPTQNRKSRLVNGINYAKCTYDQECNKPHCTFMHTDQIFQDRAPTFDNMRDCVNDICFNYHCPFKHIGQAIITRPFIADFSRPCNYGEKCTRDNCKFVHPGQQPATNERVAKSPETKWKKQTQKATQAPTQLSLGNDFPPLSSVLIAKRGNPVEFKPSTQPPTEVHDVVKIITEKQKTFVLTKDIKMPGKFDYTFDNIDFDIPFGKFIMQNYYLNSMQQKILRNIWFNGENTLEDRKNAFMRLLDEIIITSTNIVKRYYHVVTKNTLEMNEENVTIEPMNTDDFNCKLDDAIKIFKDYPYVHNIWNDGNILLEDRRNTVQTYYVDRIEENVNILNSIHDAIKKMHTITYSEIARS